MKTNSNTYTVIYSAVMVVIVAFLLAFVSQALKSRQDANVALDIKKQILNSLNLRGLSDADAEAKYQDISPSTPTNRLFMAHTSTMIQRLPDWELRSKTHRSGRNSSRVSRSSKTVR